MTFIDNSILLKTSNIIGNKSQKGKIAQLHNDLYHNELATQEMKLSRDIM